MSKKPILSKHPKKLIAFILVCLITITLAGCDSSNRKPTGDLDLSATYASAGNYSVSAGDVYNKLRYNAVSYIENEVYNFLYQEEIETLKTDLASENSIYEEKILHEIFHDVYDIHEEDELDKLDPDKKATAIDKYVDEMYQKGYLITDVQVENKDFKSVYPNYYLEVAKYIAAKNKLTKEFTLNDDESINFGDITDESYFTKDEVVTWYENNYENTGDVTAILIRFISSDEANNVLKKFGLKSSGGKWYQIQLDPAEVEKYDTQKEYDDYYKNYKLDLAGKDTSVEDRGYGKATVLKIFAAIYNYVYTYRKDLNIVNNIDNFAGYNDVYKNHDHLKYFDYVYSIIDQDSKDKDADGDVDNSESVYNALCEELSNHEDYNGVVVMDKEKLDKYSSSLTSYMYNSLKTAPEEENEKYTQYITTPKSFGSYNYLLFKIDQAEIEQEEENKLFEEVPTDDEDEKEIKFTNPTFLNEILNEMFEEEISAAYIEELFTERAKEAKLKIYDSIIETQFMYSSTSALAESYEKNKKQNNNVIAEVTYKDNKKEISVKDLYSYLEPLYGPQIAANLLFQQYIKTTDYYKDLEADYDNYVETVKLMLYYFANDYYASSGYPSSIGKYNFMMLYYGTANVEEIVKDFLMVSDATNAYYNDFAAHGFTNDEFYTNLLGYSANTYNDFYSLTASGLTVYYDKDEDGKADETLEGNDLENAKELLSVAYKVIINSHTDYATALNNVVSDFNKSSRIENDNPTSPENGWNHYDDQHSIAYYRGLGLHIEVSSFGAITNALVDADKNVRSRIEELYPVIVNEKLGFTSAYLDNEVVTTTNNRLTMLLVTGGALPTSAKYESDDEDAMKLYEKINVIINDKKVSIELNYSKDEITLEQVKVYVAEYLLLGDAYSLPASTTAALDAYVLPLITKYKGSASQLRIVRNVLGDITYHATSELSSKFNEEFSIDYYLYGRAGYLDSYNDILQRTEDNYEATYEAWWNEMYKGGSN